MTQSNKCGSIRNYEIINLPLGSGTGPWVSILWLLQDTSHINNLSKSLNSNVKLFADDSTLFSVVHNITDSANLLKSHLVKINEWALQWEMSFNPTKLAQGSIFNCKTSKRNHPGLMFNNSSKSYYYSQAFMCDIWFEVKLW